ncbi:MAG: HD-GYP domain-containing protein [Betaproteobacteria bacterium]
MLRLGQSIPVAEVARTCGELVMRIAADPDIVTYLHLLKYRDDYTFQHSVKVGVLAALVARWIKLPASEQFQVAIAGTLHDLGKAFIPLEILNKPGRLTADEFAVVQTHSRRGFELLAPEYGSGAIPPRVALEHHERMDGSGYPSGLRGRQVLLASRIVAVADVYDAMTSDRVYRRGQPQYAVLAELQENGFSVLDPQITEVFVERFVHQIHGRLVRLSDGQVGRVVFTDARDPARPIVAVGHRLIDLKLRRDLQLIGESLDGSATGEGGGSPNGRCGR